MQNKVYKDGEEIKYNVGDVVFILKKKQII